APTPRRRRAAAWPRAGPRRRPDLVCAINHAFVSGLLDGLGATTLDATLAPKPGNCCVTLGARPPSP
ncbi:hypothetical protein AB0J43_48815, partial [Nonomuraea fuscirosea]